MAAHPYRADQVGSLLRPAPLLSARAAFDRGEVSHETLRQVEDRAIDTALDLQRDVGLDIYSDGEFRRTTFQSDLTDSVDGFKMLAAVQNSSFFSGRSLSAPRLVAAGRLEQRRRLAQAEAAYLLHHARGSFKITLPTPFQFVNYLPGVSDQFYASPAELLGDLARIIAREVRALVDEGVPYIQIDAPRYSYFLDPKLAQHFKSSGADPAVSLADVLAADNACLSVEHPADVTMALHLCRGNARSTWYAEGGYDAIAEQLFNTVQADRFLLEYDDERSGGFDPLRFVPSGKTVVLGLVTTKFDTVESQDDLCRRIDAAARFVPLEHLALSPQCGFASLMEGNLIDADTQRRKLELVVDTARKVWG